MTENSIKKQKADFVGFPTEDNLILHGLVWEPEKRPEKIVIYVPGMGGGFACPNNLAALGSIMVQDGYAFMAVNLRTVNPMGILFERFEDCLNDIKAAVNFVKKIGYRDVILCGDSLGACRVSYAVSRLNEPCVKGIIFLGAIKSPYMEAAIRWTTVEKSNYDQFLETARQRIKEGRGREILMYQGWFKQGPPLILSAQTFVSLMGAPEESNANNMRYCPQITHPVFLLHGEHDSRALPQNSIDIYEILNNTDSKELKWLDMDHFFTADSEAFQIGKAVCRWLDKRFR